MNKLNSILLTVFLAGLTLDRLRKAAIMAITGKTVKDAKIYGVSIDELDGEYKYVEGAIFVRTIQPLTAVGGYLITATGEISTEILLKIAAKIECDDDALIGLIDSPFSGLNPSTDLNLTAYFVDIRLKKVVKFADKDLGFTRIVVQSDERKVIEFRGYTDSLECSTLIYRMGELGSWQKIDETGVMEQISFKYGDNQIGMLSVGVDGYGIYCDGTLIDETLDMEIVRFDRHPTSPKRMAYALTSQGILLELSVNDTDGTVEMIRRYPASDMSIETLDFCRFETGQKLIGDKETIFIGAMPIEGGFYTRSLQLHAPQSSRRL